MRNMLRIFLFMSILSALFFNLTDENYLKDKSYNEIETTEMDDFEIDEFKERIRLGIYKQSLLRLEQNIADQRDL